MRGALPSTKKPPDSSLGSEVSRESDTGSNEERCVANLYDSLAAELKQKLSTGKKGIGQWVFFYLAREHLAFYAMAVFCREYFFACVRIFMYVQVIAFINSFNHCISIYTGWSLDKQIPR